MLTVLTPAPHQRLTTVSTVKRDLGITGNGDDDLLLDLVERASATAASYCNRVFAAETVREVFRLDRPAIELLVSRLPVVAIASITVDGAALTTAEFETEGESGVVYRLFPSDTRRSWVGKVVVQYQAGFVLPGQTGRTLPADIEHATILLVKMAWFGRTRDPALKSTSVEGVGSDAFWIGDGLPADVAGLLAPYTQTALG